MMRKDLITGIAVLLLIAFVAPAWVGLSALTFGELRGDTGLGRLFFLLIFEDTPVWALLRGALGAMIAGVGALGLADRLPMRAGIVLIAVLLSFLPLSVLFVWLLDSNHAAEVWQWANQTGLNPPIEDDDAFDKGWNTFLTGQLLVLSGHAALFLGLKRHDADAPKESTT